MKPSVITRIILLNVAASTAYAAGTPITWADSAGNTAWTAGASWGGGAAPTDNLTTDAAIFTSVANAQPNLDVAARSVTGIDFQLPAGGADFTGLGATLTLGADGIDATTQLSGTSAVSVANLKAGVTGSTWTLFSNTSSASTSTFSISSDIDLNGTNLTVRSNRNSGGGNVGIVNLSGVISGTLGGNGNLTLTSGSTSTNTIHLTGNSSYVGNTLIQGTAVTANSLANAGSNSAFGSSGPIVLGTNSSFATLAFQNLSVDGSTDRLLALRGTATGGFALRNNDADNTIAFTNPGNSGDVSAAANLNFTLGGTNTGNNLFGQVINDRSGGFVTNLTKGDAGTWALSADNTYTGTTTISGGTLKIGNGGTTGSLNPASTITTNATLAFDRSDDIAQGTHFSTAAISGTGGLRKLGAGTLTLSAANTYTGVTTIGSGNSGSAGTLTVNGDHSAATGGWSINGASTVNFNSSIVVGASKTIAFANGGADNRRILNVAAAVTTNATSSTIWVVGGNTIQLNSGAIWTQNSDLRIQPNSTFTDAVVNVNSGASFTYAGGTKIILTASSSTNGGDGFLKLNGGTFTTGQGFNNNSDGTAGTANLVFSNGGTLKLSAEIPDLVSGTSSRPFNVQLGSGGGIVETSSGTNTLNVPISGTGGLTKTGAGTLATTGVNSYTGDTTVTGGILSVAGPDFDDASSITVGASGKLDLNFAGTDTVGALTINGSGPLPDGVYSNSTHPTFITGTGTLTVVAPTDNFESWANDLGLSGDPDADFDKDGIADAAEYVLGTDPKAASSSGITSQKSGNNLVFTFSRSDDSETSDITLTVEAGTTLAAWPQVFTIGATSSEGVVVTENGAAADTVTVTIPTSGSAKLFARLKVLVTP